MDAQSLAGITITSSIRSLIPDVSVYPQPICRVATSSKSDYRYSIGLVYNTFPMPPEDADPSSLEPLAQTVLDARAAHPNATLADLYDPDLMPPNLRGAHQALDRAVDRLYRHPGFASERERVEHLFALYEKIYAPLGSRMKKNAVRRTRSRPSIRKPRS